MASSVWKPPRSQFDPALYGLKITDLGPFRAGRADVLRALALEETTYGWAVEMILKGALSGFRVDGSTCKLLSAYRKIEDQRHTEGHGRRRLVHSWLNVRYYFPRRKPEISRVPLNGVLIFNGIFKRDGGTTACS